MPHDLRPRLDAAGHKTFTVKFLHWDGIRNGRLLRLAAGDGFDVIVTLDRSMAHQHNTATLPLAIVVVAMQQTRPRDRSILIWPLLETLAHLVPKTIAYVELD